MLQSQLQYPINLFINENGYIVSVNILTNNSRCCLSNITIPEKHNDIAYKVRLRLHFNDLGPQYGQKKQQPFIFSIILPFFFLFSS